MSKIGTKSPYGHETASVKVTGYLTTLQIWINTSKPDILPPMSADETPETSGKKIFFQGNCFLWTR